MRRAYRIGFASIFVFMTVVSSLALAQESAEDQWTKLPEERKEEIRNNYRTYQKMSSEEKKELDQKYEVYKTLPPSEKKRLQKNYHEFKKLSAERQTRIKKAAQKFKVTHKGQRKQHPKNHNHKH